MATVEANGATLYYETHGEGEPLLCVMGLGGNVHFWEFQTPAFAAKYRTVVFDNRGAGRSSKPSGPYTIPQLADDAVAVMDAAGLRRAHVVGISMGGMIAQDLVLRYPDRVGALVLACTYARPDRSTHRVAEEGAEKIGAPSAMKLLAGAGFDPAAIDLKQLFRFMMSLILTPEFIQREKQWLRSLLERAVAYGFSTEAFLAQVSAVMSHDAAEALKGVHTPTLVLTGTADALVPPHHSDELARLIPGAALVRIEGGTHGFNVERRDEFNGAVLEFLARHPLVH
jgi:pimeloyl-ACP methyl ester carboxylesterase